MPKAIRFKSGGKYMRNTIFSCPGLDYVGSGTALQPDFDPTNPEMMAAVAEDEKLSIASWKADFSVAFGIPADQIEVEVIPWDGVAPLPKEDEVDAIERLPVKAAPPAPPTRDQQLAAIFEAIGKDAALSAGTKAAITQAVTVLRE